MPTFLELARRVLSSAAHVGGRAAGLPEFRVSEALAAPPPRIGPESGLAGLNVQQANQVLGAQAPYQRTTSGFSSSLGGAPGGQRITGGGGGGFAQPTGAPNLQQGAEQGRDEDLSLIDQEYEQALGDLSAQESQLRGEAGTAEGAVRGEATSQEATLGRLKGESEGVVAGQETQARKTEAGGLRDVRDLFRQLQQQNIIRTSGLGISSSSVSEALAERLGVETARRIAGITGSTQEVVQNLNKERLRIQQVWSDKVNEVKTNVASQIAEIQNNLIAGINQINSQRGRATTQKAQARAGIIQEARQTIQNIQQAAFDYQQKLNATAQRRAQAIQDAIPLFSVGESGVSGLNPMVQQSIQSLGGLGLNVSPNIDVRGGQQYVTGFQTTPQKAKSADELWADYLAQQSGQ